MQKHKQISIHAVALFLWLLASIVYLYSQNNAYSCAFVLVFLYWLSRNYITLRWKDLFYSWGLVSAGLVVFYGLFLHEGDHPIFKIPGNIPLLSGLISWNSILYGFFLGGSFSIGLFLFSLFSTFLTQQRSRFYLPGIGSNFSILFSFLSHYVAFFLHHRNDFEQKIKNRGLKLSWISHTKLFLHDSAFHAFENAFAFSETLEMRGFSREKRSHFSFLDYSFVISMVVLISLLVMYRIHHNLLILGFASVVFLLGVVLVRKIQKKSYVATTYKYAFSMRDWILLVWSCVFLGFCLHASFINQSFLSRHQLMGYFIFDWKTHAMFMIHFGVAYLLFGKVKYDSAE